MKIRVFAAGVAAVLITGGAATVAQRVITQKTRGVLPVQSDQAHADSRSVTLAIPAPGIATPPVAQLALNLVSNDPVPATLPVGAGPTLAVEPDHPALPAPPAEPTVAVVEPAPAPSPNPGPEPDTAVVAAEPPQPLPTDPAISRATNPGNSAAVDESKGDPVETVETFLERNRKEAEAAIQALTTEEENLKSRLGKVQTALVRWQSFSHALSADQPVAQPAQPTPAKANWKRPETESPAPSSRIAQPEPAPKPAEDVSPPTPVTEVANPTSLPAAPGLDPATPPGDPKPTEPLPAPPENPTIPNH